MNLSPVEEDYLKEIYHLERHHSRPVRTGEIADTVGVTAPSVSNMVEQLDESGLVQYTPYKGVKLTENGETVVLALIRKHRLLETFLAQYLDFQWCDVHEEADRLEHHITDEFTAQLAAFLGNPRVDPHGDPIPDETLEMKEEQSLTPLVEYDPGEIVVVERVPHRDSDLGEYLRENGINPEAELLIEEKSPVDLITVRPESNEKRVSLPTHTARRVEVRPDSPAKPANNLD